MPTVFGLLGCTAPSSINDLPDGNTPIAYNAELEHLRTLNEAAPPEDLQVTVLLLQEYQADRRCGSLHRVNADVKVARVAG
ncbi:MAG: hypothetical protein AAF713_20660 [Pseudomonadota bacterium]